jgi:hypothetical protein
VKEQEKRLCPGLKVLIVFASYFAQGLRVWYLEKQRTPGMDEQLNKKRIRVSLALQTFWFHLTIYVALYYLLVMGCLGFGA